MKLDEARSALGLGPDEDPRPQLAGLRAHREALAALVRDAPNEHLAMRHQRHLVEYDRALAAVREYLEALGLWPGGGEGKAVEVGDGAVAAVIVAEEGPVAEGVAAEEWDRPRRSAAGVWLALVVVALLAGGALLAWRVHEERLRVEKRESLESQGRALLESRRWQDAERVFAELERLAPGAAVVRWGRARVEEGRAEEDSQFLAFWSGQARAELEAGRWQEAEQAAGRVLERHPGHAEALLVMEEAAAGRSHARRQEAIGVLRGLLEAGEWVECVEAAARWLEEFPGDSEISAWMAEARAGQARELEHRQRARHLLEQARAADRGEYDAEVLALLREAAALAPGDGEIAAMLERVSSYHRTLRVPEDFPDLASALAEAGPGDRLVLGEGEWEGPIRLTLPVQIEGAGAGKTRVLAEAAAGAALAFAAEAGGSRVQGIAFAHRGFDPAPERFSAVLVAGAEVEFVDCHFLDASGHGLAVIEGGRVVVRRGRFVGNGWNGIGASGPGSRLEVRESEASGNFGHGIEVWQGAAAVIVGNRCQNNSRNGLHVDAGEGEAEVESNVWAGNREYGLVLGSARGGRVVRNRARGNLLGGIVLRRKAAAVTVVDNQMEANEGPGLLLETGLAPVLYAENRHQGNRGENVVSAIPFEEFEAAETVESAAEDEGAKAAEIPRAVPVDEVPRAIPVPEGVEGWPVGGAVD